MNLTNSSSRQAFFHFIVSSVFQVVGSLKKLTVLKVNEGNVGFCKRVLDFSPSCCFV